MKVDSMLEFSTKKKAKFKLTSEMEFFNNIYLKYCIQVIKLIRHDKEI